MPRLARNVIVDRAARTLTIDGEEFPWFTTDGIEVEVSSRGNALRGPVLVTLTIPVDGDVAIIGEVDSVGDERDAPRLRDA